MNYDQFITHGLEDQGGAFLWRTIRDKVAGHNDLLAHMGVLQRQLTAYAKTHKMDAIQQKYVSDIRLLEVLAWRMYMYGPQWLALRPGPMGEFMKRRRTDLEYRKVLSRSNIESGTVGCEELENTYRKIKRRCAKPACKHQGLKKADKWLKRQMRRSWEIGILSRFKY